MDKLSKLSSNIGFVSKGGKEDILIIDMYKIPEETITIKAHLDYISFNTVVEIKYPITDVLSPFISLGPRFDYLIGKNSSEKGFLEGIKNDIKKYNYGLIIGGGLKYDLSKIQIGVQAHYYVNFIKVVDNPPTGNSFGLSINDNTTSINFTLGYKLK